MTVIIRTFAHERSPPVAKRTPSPQRQRVLDFITAEIAAGRPFPTHRQIADHMGWKATSSVNEALNFLFYDGHLKKLRRVVNQIVWGLA